MNSSSSLSESTILPRRPLLFNPSSISSSSLSLYDSSDSWYSSSRSFDLVISCLVLFLPANLDLCAELCYEAALAGLDFVGLAFADDFTDVFSSLFFLFEAPPKPRSSVDPDGSVLINPAKLPCFIFLYFLCNKYTYMGG